MATDNSDKQSPDSSPSKKSADGMSMKERLLAQRKAAEGAGAPSKPASAPPVPAARPATRPAAAPATKPAATSARSAAEEAPVAKRPVKLSAAREEARSGSKKPVSEDVRREIEMLRKSQDKWITYGWMVALGLLLVAGVTYYITHGKKVAIEEAEKARIASIQTWIDEIKGLDLMKPADQDKFDALIKDPANEPRWKTTTLDAMATTTRIRSTIAKNREDQIQMKGLIDGINELEEIARNASSKSSEDLAKARRRLREYEGRSELAIEQTQRVAKSAVQIEQAYAAKLHEEAKAAAAKGPSEIKNALAAYTKAEDEIIKLLDDATKKKLEDQKNFYLGHYKEMITECDALVATAFTPEVIDKTPWLDLLTSPGKDGWQQAGFTGWQIKDGVMQGLTELGAKATSVMSVGDREQWRDFVLEMEFIPVKGDPVLHARLGRTANTTTINYSIGTSGQNAFKPGSTNTITVTVIGSTAKASFSDSDHSASEDSLSQYMARKGGIGISVPPGAEIKVTKMRIKALR